MGSEAATGRGDQGEVSLTLCTAALTRLLRTAPLPGPQLCPEPRLSRARRACWVTTYANDLSHRPCSS